MFKKISISFLIVIIFSIVFWTLVNFSSDLIFSTNAKADGEPHKANFIFNMWIILSILIFIFSLFKSKLNIKKPLL